MNTRRFAGIIPALLLLAVCASASPVEPQTRRTFEFRDSGITFDTQFDGARLSSVREAAPGEFVATIRPENEPVNDSPWYAFRAKAKKTAQVRITLEYVGAPHRYAPKISWDGTEWTTLTNATKGTNCTFELTLGPSPVYVAGQEIFTTRNFAGWMERLSGHSFVSRRTIGRSILGRPMELLEISEAPESADVILVVGRQHPPEVTGTIALTNFVETLCSQSADAKAFRKNFRVLVAPLANPDGVNGGHWRHNINGVDLNRDWGSFAQPETRAIRDEFVRIVESKKVRVRFGLDFHSTREDVLYTGGLLSPEDPAGAWWLSKFRQLAGTNLVPALGDSGAETPLPPRTKVCAAWIHARFKAPAVTFETGDNTDREQIRKSAEAAAHALCAVLAEGTELAPGLAIAPSATPLNVALYVGRGVGGQGPDRISAWFATNQNVQVTRITPEPIRNNEIAGYDAIIFPGGSGSAQGEALGPEGRENVRRFTRNGGAYLGICAGSYLACSSFSWGVQVLDAKTASPKWQRGAGKVLVQLTRPGASAFGVSYGPYEIKYENGPILVPAGNPEIPDFTPWGVFVSEMSKNDAPKGIMTGAPAIVTGTYGNGRVVCFSPHPEQTAGLEPLVEKALYWATEKSKRAAAGN